MPFWGKKKKNVKASSTPEAQAAKSDFRSQVEATSFMLGVAAIDFGTTYSGWGFSFKQEFDKDPTKVLSRQWTGSNMVSQKAPTCVLIEPDGKTLNSFGYDAETKYGELLTEDEHTDWYFFRRFKMLLFDNQALKRKDFIEDECGKQLPAKTVFSLAIKYLKDDLLKMCGQQIGCGLKDTEIYWVLTVPAIWNDAAKQFMREAAEEAGIGKKRLTIALEPEAASLYCRHLPVEKNGQEKLSLKSFGSGKRYVVLDAGGGTVDITVHEVMKNGYLKELHKASGGAWGGTKVDEAFFDWLAEVVGVPALREFKQKHKEDYLDMCREFELRKRNIGSAKITIKVPASFASTVESISGDKLSDKINKPQYADKVKLAGDKMRVNPEIVRGFFERSVNSITSHLSTLLCNPRSKNVEAIVMVGGFSESTLLQDAIRSHFTNLMIIVPDEPSTVVLKGAVIFGHNPAYIAERVSKYTYGVGTFADFDHDEDDVKKLTRDSRGRDVCEDIFSKLVEAGQTLVIGEAQEEKRFYPMEEDQSKIDIEIYATLDTNPKYVDDPGCKQIGSFTVPLPGSGLDREMIVKMIFGGTEIVLEYKDVSTGEVTNFSVDFLS